MAFPLKPPSEWFDLPEATSPTPLTFEKSGKVYGHLAVWGACHTGFLEGGLGQCVSPPPSKTNYQHFHLGVLETQEGKDVRVGKLTYQTNHAPVRIGLQAAVDHYSHTGTVGAYLRARDGNVGVWVSGSVRSDISPETFRDLRANPPSGDWRVAARGGSLELVAALSVPVPGFPIPKAELALSASAVGDPEVQSLILSGYVPEEEELALVASAEYKADKARLLSELAPSRRSKDYLRQIHSLTRV